MSVNWPREVDWDSAFGAGEWSSVNAEHIPFTQADVKAICRFHEESPEGYASQEVRAIFLLNNGRFAFFEAGCDTTGWDCQAGASGKTYDNLSELVDDLDRQSREAFNFTLQEEIAWDPSLG